MGAIVPQVITEDRAGGALVIDGGLRFTGSSYLKRTPGSAGSSTYTISCWVKRSHLAPDGSGNTNSNANPIFAAGTNAGSDTDDLQFYKDAGGNNNKIRFLAYPGAFRFDLITSMVFRDTSSWYHILANYDGTTAKIYVNGTQVTAFASSTQNGGAGNINTTDQHTIGSTCDGSTAFFRGYISQFYLIDGQALDPSYFGYTDPLTNTWRPKKLSSSVAFGTNGFYLPFDGNSPIGQDMSGKGNNWTPVNFGGSNTIEKATGALPILNTDGGGKVARVGVRTDTAVGAAVTCVVALPLVGIKSDFSNKIDSRSTEKAITNNSVTFSSTYGNLYGASGYFGGSAYLVTDLTSFNMDSDFTIEFWWYKTGTQTNDHGHFLGGVLGGTNSYGPTWRDQGSSDFQVTWKNTSSPSVLSISGGVALNEWHHYAFVYTKSDNSLRAYVDGALRQTTTSLFSSNPGSWGSSTEIGRGGPGWSSQYVVGYVQDYRIYQGAKYTQNFIPASTDPDILPDTPSGVSYSSNVALVPSTDGAVGFNRSSYLSLTPTSDFVVGTGDFTLEGFVYFNSLAAEIDCIMDSRSSTSASDGFLLGRFNTAGHEKKIEIFTNSDYRITGDRTVENGVWTHFAVVRSSGTTKIYIDGKAYASTYSDSNNYNNTSTVFKIGSSVDNSYSFNGFLSNFHIVKGTALYTSNFTPPTAPITSVANTKLLCCKSNSSATAFDVSPGTITANGDAAATNFNPFTVNINTQRGQETDWTTLSPLIPNGSTLSNGNLSSAGASAAWCKASSDFEYPSSGKWYWEGVITGTGAQSHGIGIAALTAGTAIADLTTGTSYYAVVNNTGTTVNKVSNGTATSLGTIGSFVQGDIFGVAVDAATKNIWIHKNGIYFSGGDPASGSTPLLTGTGNLYPTVWGYNTSGKWDANFGQKPFKFPPPAGFQPLALANTPRPTIVRPDQYVGIVTYTGTGATRSLTTGFKPDFLWIKERGASGGPVIVDSVRGASATLQTHATTQEQADSDAVTGFNPYGFSLGSGYTVVSVNGSTRTYVAWAWKAGGEIGVGRSFMIDNVGFATAGDAGMNTGTKTPTGASVNTKSGFSIIAFTGDQNAGTISHGLGKAPSFYIVKTRDSNSGGSNDWYCYHSALGASARIQLNSDSGQTTGSSQWNSTSPTSSVLSLGSGTWQETGDRFIIYAWAEIPGFSKFGSYNGNQSADGPTIITGFRPRFILIKSTSASTNWRIIDTERSKYNPGQEWLLPNSANAEPAAERPVDILSNGFKIRVADGGDINYSTSALTYIYCAFAETPSFNLYGGQSNAR